MAVQWAETTRVRLLGCTLTFRIEGAEEWVRYYHSLRGRAKNLQPVFERFGQYMLQGSLMRNFAAEGRPERWAPLSPEYARRKAIRYPGAPILVATGAMRAGFTYTATPQTLKIDNAMFYWWFHQVGTTRMPQRVIVLLQAADRALLTRWIRDYLLSRTAQWG